jgi:3-hydroxyacyl-[acyl-carrier-protein] dehydratase
MEKLEIQQIREILPQEYPFIMIDRVIELEPGERVTAIKSVTATENYFPGHFPKNPVMPGTLIVEAMAQASIVLYHSKYKNELTGIPQYYLGSIKAEFKRKVIPGDQLRIEAVATKLIKTGAMISLKAYVGDELAAESDLVFAVKT